MKTTQSAIEYLEEEVITLSRNDRLIDNVFAKLYNSADPAHHKLLRAKELIPSSRIALVTLAFVSISEISFASYCQLLTSTDGHLHNCVIIYPSKHL